MAPGIIDTFKFVEEIRIQLPNSRQPDWLTEIVCTNSAGLRVKLSLSSVDRYANIWGLTHDFEEMELFDLFDGSTRYEYGRYKLRIKYEANVDEQWFKSASVEEL